MLLSLLFPGERRQSGLPVSLPETPHRHQGGSRARGIPVLRPQPPELRLLLACYYGPEQATLLARASAEHPAGSGLFDPAAHPRRRIGHDSEVFKP
jgi:hypothetical protein